MEPRFQQEQRISTSRCDVEALSVQEKTNHGVLLNTALHSTTHRENSPYGEHISTDSPVRDFNNLHWALICTTLYISIFIYGLDTTIAADVQGSVVEEFGQVDQLAWIGVGFPLGTICVIMLNAVLYEVFDMKWVYALSTVLFQAGSALCGAAPNMPALIVGRVIAGAGGSGVFMGCLNYFSNLVTPEKLGLYISGTGFCWGIGAVLGPIVGGSFEASFTWRWAFYVNLIIGAACSPVYVFGLPSIRLTPGKSFIQKVRTIDFVGLLLGAGIWVLFSVVLTMVGGAWQWTDSRTIAVIILFAVAVILYAIQQACSNFTEPTQRSLPVSLLRSRSQVLLCISTSANITSLFVIVYFIPIYFQFVHNDSALQAALRFLPYVAVTVCINILAGHLLTEIKYYAHVFIVSGIFIILGGSLLYTYLTPNSQMGYIYAFTIITAIGSGLTLQISFPIAALKAPGHKVDALALQNMAQIGGTVISLLIAGLVFQSTAAGNLARVLANTGFTNADIRSVIAGAKSNIFEELTGDLRDEAILSITQAIQKSFTLVIAGGAVLTSAGLLMKQEQLFGDVMRVRV